MVQARRDPQVALALLFAAALAAPLWAASPAAPKAKVDLPGELVELKTPDGWTLKARYVPAQPGHHTFVLLHGKGQRREWWLKLARALTADGFGMLAPDMRGHGDSAIGPSGEPLSYKKFKVTKTENDWADMALDVQAAVAHLSGLGLEEDTIGLIGADVSGSVALKYAAVHAAVPMVVLFSPGMSYQEVLTVNAMRRYKDRPVLMIYGELDKTAARATPILYEFARRAAGERNAVMVSVPRRHGYQLVTAKVSKQVVDWIYDPVKPELPPAVSTPTATSPEEGAELEPAEEPPVPAGG